MTVKIFPGGDVPAPEAVVEASRNGNFELVHAESLRPHYAKTLDCWAANLAANEKKAVEIAGEQIFRIYMKYLTSCANFFRSGEVNVYQFKLRKI
jgi:cyclopropane-fatty-acyl-phospholipid synthase